MAASNLGVRSYPECVAKLFAALRARNNRILVDGATNQRCALSSDVESMFRQQPLKIVLQHIHPESGHCSDEVTRPLSANSRHRACGFKMRASDAALLSGKFGPIEAKCFADLANRTRVEVMARTD
jgi:hypothetical protein